MQDTQEQETRGVPTWKGSLEGGVVVGAFVGAPLADADGGRVGHFGGRGGRRRREGVGVGGDGDAAVFGAAARDDVAGVRPRSVAALLKCLLLSAL